MSTMDVHPVADLFPMLADDELAELAADIKARGLIQPIVLDVQGRVLDGRNRLAACELACVEPEYERYDGDDPDGYALAVNGQRREMTKRQKAIVAAQFSRLENYGDQRKAARALGVTDAYVSEAMVIVEYAKELATAVIVGAHAFSDALTTARERQARERDTEAKMGRLRDDALDLLALVDEERMSLDDAIGALDAREDQAREEERQRRSEADERERQEREAARQANTKLAEAVNYLSASTTDAWRALTAGQWHTGACDATPPARESVEPDNLRAIADGLHKLADQMEQEK